MRICLICVEIFAWGKYGGFGRATRTIGRALVERGHQVFAVVPRRAGQGAVERLDGITVLGYPRARPWQAAELLRGCDADIYHSCEPSLTTTIARRVLPGRAHIVTFRDPRGAKDWLIEFAYPSASYLQVATNWLFEASPLVSAGIRAADGHHVAFHDAAPAVHRRHRLRQPPSFLPTPVTIPPPAAKADRPTVCYLARLDRRKRPELFFALAERFPQVRFIALGGARDPRHEAALRRRWAGLANLELLGFVDQFGSDLHHRTLAASWVLVNTAKREGLPNAFLEAAAHGCAILSTVDTDRFASRFGRHAAAAELAPTLAWLLADERWRVLGEAARAHVAAIFTLDAAVDQHLAAYKAARRAAQTRLLTPRT